MALTPAADTPIQREKPMKTKTKYFGYRKASKGPSALAGRVKRKVA